METPDGRLAEYFPRLGDLRGRRASRKGERKTDGRQPQDGAERDERP